jgi:CBS domain-containing protein
MSDRVIRVEDYMSSKPLHISQDDSLSFVMNMFERAHISGAPVTNARGEYVGVISKTDLASSRMLKLIPTLSSAKAKDLMTPGTPISITKDAPLEEAVDLMVEKAVHRLFVKDESGKIIGVLSSFDLLRAIQRPTEQEQALKLRKDVPAAQAEKKEPKLDKEKAERDKDIEKRIFTLVNRKYDEAMGQQKSSGSQA